MAITTCVDATCDIRSKPEGVLDSWRSPLAAMAAAIGGRVVEDAVFPAREDQLVRIRRMVRTAASGHHERDIIVLLAHELATNSMLHSGSGLIGLIVARTDDGGLRVAVYDQHRAGFPHPHERACGRKDNDIDIDIERDHGRGLQLVETMATRWGIVSEPGVGLITWFDIS